MTEFEKNENLTKRQQKNIAKVIDEKAIQVKREPLDPPKQLVYCGPTLKNLQQYSVFRGEFPEHVKEIIKNRPLIENLFIQPKDLNVVRYEIEGRVKGSFYFELYKENEKIFKGVN